MKGLHVALTLIKTILPAHKGGPPFPKLAVRGLNLADPTSDAMLMCQKYEAEIKRRTAIERRVYSDNPIEIENDILHADCLVMPSQSEPFGLVALEAIALGTPVFISNQSGIAEMLLRLVGPGRPAGDLPLDFILDVNMDEGETASNWEPCVLRCLADVSGALARADALRKALASHMNWRLSASKLVDWLRSH